MAPIGYDNAMDGDRANRIDVTYPMANITGDTAGGLWTESAGSWLHLDKDGNTVRRYNDDSFITVHAISAVSPTVLAVSRTDRADILGPGTGLFLYDTDQDRWDSVNVVPTTTGDVVVDNAGRIVFVDFLGSVAPGAVGDPGNQVGPTPFAIRAVDSSGEQTTVLEADEDFRARAVAIDADATGVVYVSTERETFSVGADGTREPISTHPERRPVLAVSAAGNVLVTAPRGGGAEVPWAMASGSSPARDVMSQYGDCAQTKQSGLSLLGEHQAVPLPFTCGVSAAVWIDDVTFVISIGPESSAILAEASAPQQARGPSHLSSRRNSLVDEDISWDGE